MVESTVVAPRRVLSVDLLRGITIAFMILVNDPGDWEQIFRQLDHADWNGWTLTDLVFPTFLFLIGASLIFSLSARVARGNCWKTLTGQILLRSVKIFLLGLMLAFFPRMHWTHLRLFGVLPRIALCYGAAGLLLVGIMRRRWRMPAIVCAVVVLLLGYWVLMRWVPVPGAGVPVRDVGLLDEVRNLASWVDRGVVAWTQRWLHTGRLYKEGRDPEGLLSTLPAIATTLLGALAGLWMQRAQGSRGSRTVLRMQAWMLAAGVVFVAAGELWGRWFPINKNLWTSSYVLLTAGWAAIVLALLSWLVDGRPEPWPRWLRAAMWPWFVFGSNAIVAYTFSEVIVKCLLHYRVAENDDHISVWEWIYHHGFARTDSTRWTSLAFAVVFVTVCFLPNWWLWRRKWFLKI
jgi:predicted acyltransferase